MHLLCLIWLLIGISINRADDSNKYSALRSQCEKYPSKLECVQLKTKFLQLIKKCLIITTPEQFLLCQQVKNKLCDVFPSLCSTISTINNPKVSSSTKKSITTSSTTAKSKLITTLKKDITTTTQKKPVQTTTSIATTAAGKKPATTVTTKAATTVTTTTTTTKTMAESKHDELNNEEFAKVPVDPEELRTRGEYCIRHGREKKCQELLVNLKNTYSSCSKKKPTVTKAPTKLEEIDCHSFQTHLCKAFPKFPPCVKATST